MILIHKIIGVLLLEDRGEMAAQGDKRDTLPVKAGSGYEMLDACPCMCEKMPLAIRRIFRKKYERCAQSACPPGTLPYRILTVR